VLALNLPARTPAQFRAAGIALFSAAAAGRAEHRVARLLAPHEVRA